MVSIQNTLLWTIMLLITALLSPTRSASQSTGDFSIGKYKLDIGDLRPHTAAPSASRQNGEASPAKRYQRSQRRLEGTSVPEAPTGVYGVQSSSEPGTALVAWMASVDNNSTISAYEVTSTRAGVSPVIEEAFNVTSANNVTDATSAAPTSVNVTGLITGSAYTFRVRAINSVGAGAQSVESDEVVINPGRIKNSAMSMSTLEAGGRGTIDLNFTCQHALPLDGFIYVELNELFTSVANKTEVSVALGNMATLKPSTDNSSITISLTGSLYDIPADTQISIQMNDVTNPYFEGTTFVVLALKTMENDRETPIDEASSDFNEGDRPAAVRFTPAAFVVSPSVTLNSVSVGDETSANVGLVTSNPLPIDGHIIVEFPRNFTSIHSTGVSNATNIDGGFNVSVGADGYTVDIHRNGTGTEVSAGTSLMLTFDGITNQQFEGPSDVFPLVKTTLLDKTVSIDEASSDFNEGDRPAAVRFTPSAFVVSPSVTLNRVSAGDETSAKVGLVTANPLPIDGHIIVEFPRNFTSIHSTGVSNATNIDGGFNVSVGADGYTVDIHRNGTGTEVSAGASLTLTFDGITNQQFEGPSDVFPLVKTTLLNTTVSIDEASSDFNEGDRPAAVRFTPSAFVVSPSVTLNSVSAGDETSAKVGLVTSNPLPIDGHIIVEFPRNFTSIHSTGVSNATNIDGGFNVSVGADGYTVDIHRNGTGTEVSAGASLTLTFDGITNQQFEGPSDVFPLVKTTLLNTTVSIDEASSDFNEGDRPAAVRFTPSAFVVSPSVTLNSVSAGDETSAKVGLVTSNPLPIDGHIIVEFPRNFTSIHSTGVSNATNIDGGFNVSVGADGYTVDIHRNGTGTEVSAGASLTLTFDGITNQQFEGPSDVFPLVKTTLLNTTVSIDEASSDFNEGDRPAAVWFTPAAFVVSPSVTLNSVSAGDETSTNVGLVTSNPLPIDGHIIVEFPRNFTSIHSTGVSNATNIDGGFNVSVGADGYTVDIHRNGTGTEVSAGASLTLTFDGITNQQFEGPSDVFPLVKTTLLNTTVSIDEASSDFNEGDRPAAVRFTPSAFVVSPSVTLNSVSAGDETSAKVGLVTSNPLPIDGHIIVEFPRNFTSIHSTGVSNATNIDGGFNVSVGADGYTVDIHRNGTGTEVSAGASLTLTFDGITNQQFEGPSDVFPLVKTTLLNTTVSIDEASSDFNEGDRPAAVRFTPSAFVVSPSVTLNSVSAGDETSAKVGLVTSNPLPIDGHIIVEFPRNFTSIHSTGVSNATNIDGGFNVSVGADGYTVDIHRNGTGTEVSAGASLTLTFDGITNQQFEGPSDVFPLVKTTLLNTTVSIDEASSDFNEGDRPAAVRFTPSAFVVSPSVTLNSVSAGDETSAKVGLVTSNPLPIDGHIIVEFPRNFTSIHSTGVSNATNIDGGFNVSVGADGYTVDIHRNGTGTEVSAGASLTLTFDGITNQQFEGPSDVFPLVKTTLLNTTVSIDEASSDFNEGDRPAAVRFTPSAFVVSPSVTLNSVSAGDETSAKVGLVTSNPLPIDGHIIVEFPRNFTSIHSTGVSNATNIDGGFNVSVGADGYTVDIHRNGTGTEVSAGASLTLTFDGITNQHFEGPSDVFPLVKTTLLNTTVSIDEASSDFNEGDRPAAVWFTPAAFVVSPSVTLNSVSAGDETSTNVGLVTSNPLPIDGHIIVEFPRNFTSIHSTGVSNATNIDGGFNVSVGADGYTVDIHRNGTGTEVSAGASLTLTFDGITNQQFEGPSDVFPLVKTTLLNTTVSIDEASSDFNEGDRPAAVRFTPSAFVVSPSVTLNSVSAGDETSAKVGLVTSNPLPIDGHIIVEFPRNFTSIHSTGVSNATNIDGGFNVSVGADGYTVDIHRNGTGTEVSAGTSLTLTFDGITNQQFEGPSDVFPLVKTTLSDKIVSIDEASSDFNEGDRPAAVRFTPAAFVVSPSVTLNSVSAGDETSTKVGLVTSNPLPIDGHIIVEFPRNFTSIHSTGVSNATNIDGGFNVSVGADGYTVDIHRNGTGTEVSAGTSLTLTFDGITNQQFEGPSDVFPLVKTTLSDKIVSIDEASSDFNEGDRPAAVRFTPAAFVVSPSVTLNSVSAGDETSTKVGLVTSNPLPIDGHIIVEFPRNFTSIHSTGVSNATNIDGGFNVSVGADGYTVDIHRNGTGTEVSAGASLTLTFDGITNQQFEGPSDVFPLVKTTLSDKTVSIDEASSDFNEGDRPAAVRFTPAAFVVSPSVTLNSVSAGDETSTNVGLVTANPLPIDGHIIVEFPRNFTSIHSTGVSNATNIDGGFNVSVGVDGYTVDIHRNGTGTEVSAGTSLTLTFDGITNQQFEGPSDVFPLVKTTLSNTTVSIDEAGSDFNEGDRPAAVWFTPAAFVVSPSVTLNSVSAGDETSTNVGLVTANPLPIDGHIIVEFPRNFTSIHSTGVSNATNIDGGFNVSVGADGYTVDVHRDRAGTVVSAGTSLTLMLEGITNQQFEGQSDVFPLVKTTLSDKTVSIDEASSDFNQGDRPAAVRFTPAAFGVSPSVTLNSVSAGAETSANVSLVTSNPLPIDGHIILEFPRDFTSIHSTGVSATAGIDGGFNVSVRVDGYTVDVHRNGTGTEVSAGTSLTLMLEGITNQQFEGPSDVFPVVKTTVLDTSIAIDEASSDFNDGDRPAGVQFTPATFVTPPTITLQSVSAGDETSANVGLVTSNPLPIDGHIIVEFPRNFTSIHSTGFSAATNIDAGFNVSVGADGYTVDVRRDGTGTEVSAGTSVTLTFDGITNQQFEGLSDVFPLVKTTLSNTTVSIDEASSDFNEGDRPAAVRFTPAAFQVTPTVTLQSASTGAETSANVSLVTSNPLPIDGHVIVEFPKSFWSIHSTGVSATAGIDGGFNVSVGVDGYTVDVHRAGTGTEVSAGESLVLMLDGITNQQFEGLSDVFPLVKTTLLNTSIAIDEASSDFNEGDHPAAVRFTPAAFAVSPTVTLHSISAGAETSANVSLVTSNPLPNDGHIIVEFPRNFTSIHSTGVSATPGIDGGFNVSVTADGYTVDIHRNGTGTEVSAGQSLSLTFDGITNQQFEGLSDVFPLVKTTLWNTSISIDEASSEFNGGDRPAAVRFTPAAFAVSPIVTLNSVSAGAETSANISLISSNPLPIDGHIIVEFPKNFASIHSTGVLATTGIDGGFTVSVGADGYTVDVHRNGTGTEVSAGTSVTLICDGITNQQFEGLSDVFPLVKMTSYKKSVSIDEASSDFNEDDRPAAVLFSPAAFAVAPIVTLHSVSTGAETSANVTLVTSNPLPFNGHIIVEFPKKFTSIHSARASATAGIDGGFNVSVDVDGYTVDIHRNGTGTDVSTGTRVTMTFDGITNQQFEGLSGVFPLAKTTLSNTSIAIDEASSDLNEGDRPAAIRFTPAAFAVSPTVTLHSVSAGAETLATVRFVTSNPLPIDARVIVEFPRNFAAIHSTGVLNATNINGGFTVSVGADGYTVDAHRNGTGTEVSSGTSVTFTLDGITNQQFEGLSDLFPLVKTTLSNTTFSINEASLDFNEGDRAAAVTFANAAFAISPSVTLNSVSAGDETSANIGLVMANPLPIDGHIIVEFPRNFTSIHSTGVSNATNIDGGFNVSVGANGYTVDIHRNGTGTEVSAGTSLTFTLDGITNQQFEGLSDVFPLVKTTLSDKTVSIDEASSDFNEGDRAAAIRFTPAAFVVSPSVTLNSVSAGVETSANLRMVTSNPLPIDGHIVVEFPRNFTSIHSTGVSNATNIDGGFNVSVGADGYTVDVRRNGTGTEVSAGTSLTFILDGITNQQFEGLSHVFPLVKTTLLNTTVSIDEASSVFNEGDRPAAVRFTPAAFAVSPSVTLNSVSAGAETSANVGLVTSNPLPIDGHVIIEFPMNFTSIHSTDVSATVSLDGGFTVSVLSDGYTVDVHRDGTGTEVSEGTSLMLTFDGITNQQFEGPSDVFPLVKTTLWTTGVSIDEASSDFNEGDRPAAVRFTPAAFAVSPSVSLNSVSAGAETSANISLVTSNPLPIDGHIIVEFPRNFTSIHSTGVSNTTNIDGGFNVSVGADGYTVDVRRDGAGTEVPAGTSLTLSLAGITNQQFEGLSGAFPLLKTTLWNTSISIDDLGEGRDLIRVFFAATTFPLLNVTLQYDVAGMHSDLTINFTTVNPLPSRAMILVELSGFADATPLIAESDELGSLSPSGSSAVAVAREGSGALIAAGTSVSLTLSTVVNRGTVGDTGNFSVTTFTDDAMTSRIDYGVAPSVKIGKTIISASAAFGSSSVAVVDQPKRWTLAGYGVALGDRLKWVNSSALSDEHCDWETQTIDVEYSNSTTSTAVNITFAESSDGTGPLKLCYSFSSGNQPFKLYDAITVSVYELYSVAAAEEGSISVSVVGYPKVLTLSGYGLAASDQVRWLIQGSTTCMSENDTVGLVSGSDNGENTALLSSSGQVSFDFTEDVFTAGGDTGNASANATLCYKFGSEQFQHYPALSVGIRHVTGWTSSVGGDLVAVVGVTEIIRFTGFGISDGTFVGDRARWITSGTNCSENIAAIADATDGRIGVSSAQGSFTFRVSASGETPRLCYWFEDEPAMVYSSLTINVAHLSVLSAPSYGDADVAVAGYPKQWAFAGGHIEDGDLVRWLYNGSSDCTATALIAEMAEDGEITSGETECTFVESLAGRWITPCYRHSSEPWRHYSMPVYVKMVQNMTALWGNDSACVVEQPKQWIFDGQGLASNDKTDLIKFVIGNTDCQSGSDVPLSDSDSDGVAMYISAAKNATFTFMSAAAGETVFLCYKFGNEEYMWYNIQVHVHMLQQVESRVGGKDIAVVDVPEVLVIHANGTTLQDHTRWIVGDGTSSDAACNDSIVYTWDSTDSKTTDTLVYSVDNTFLANFTFESSSAGLSPILCYKFAGERWKVYNNVAIDVAMLQGVQASEGSDRVAVVDYAKNWLLSGAFLAAGDQMFWSTSSCDTRFGAKLIGDSDGILVVDDALAPSFVFASLSSGSIVNVCYRFNDEPFKVYNGFEIDIRMIRAVAVDYGSAKKTIPDVSKTFSFVGDGTAIEARLDSVKWIHGEDCLADGIVGNVGDVDGLREFELGYFEATEFTAQTIEFPESEIGGPYAMCYSFDREPYQIYSDLVMTVLGITDVTAEDGADDIIVVGATKRLYFTGGGAIEAGDQAIWVSGAKVDSDCLVDVFVDGPQGTVDSLLAADFFIADGDSEAMAGHTWTLCYQFGAEQFKIYPSFVLSAVTLDSFEAEFGSRDDSVVGYPKTFYPGGAGISEGDRAKWVSSSVTTDSGCDNNNGVVDESMVIWATYTTPADSTRATSSTADALLLASSFTFTTPTIGAARVQLCYQHQSEPYRLHSGLMLGTRQLISAKNRELGTEQTLKSIVDSPQAVAFVAYGGMEGDRYKWVQPFSINNTALTSAALIENCAESVDAAAGSSIGVAAGFYQEASFTFSEPASNLMLCYGPGSEPYMPYPAMTMGVISSIISSASPTHVIVGRESTIRLIGTFGLTSGDAMKLADNADGDCEGNPAGGDEIIFYPETTATGLTAPALGTSHVTLYISERTAENRPYKLCYRFGTAGLWELFDSVSLEAYEVTEVSVDVGDGSPATGALLDFKFGGTGIVDGGMTDSTIVSNDSQQDITHIGQRQYRTFYQAKWISAASSSDTECETRATVADSSSAYLLGGVAQFAFNGDVEDWFLCYKHGIDDWRLYSGITPVSTSTATSEAAVSDTQRTQAAVSLTLEGNIASYPSGSVARANFEEAFLEDLSRALGVKKDRFTVTNIRAGSVVVDFTIDPTGSLADASVDELLVNLETQMSDDSSALRTGNVTSAAKSLAATMSLIAELTAVNSSTAVIGLSVVEFQEKGLFGFTSAIYYTTEASGKVTLTIQRSHGTKGVLDIGYSTSDGSATGDVDYLSTTGMVRFYDGDTTHTFDILLVNDADIEPHFETFTAALSLRGPINDGAALAAAAEAMVVLYDYGDGVVLANTTFVTGSTVSSATSSLEDNATKATVDFAAGWTISDNGGYGGWVDSTGFAAKDAVFGADEYADRCDYAATSPCDYDCIFGDGLAELFPTTGESPSVLHLNGKGYVTTMEPVTDFPSTTFSISCWVRAVSSSGGQRGGTVVSYVTPDASPGEYEILLHDLSRLSLLVHGTYVSASARYDGPSGGDLGGIRTTIDVASDGAWHHVAVAWRSTDGNIEAFVDGARVFDGGPYKVAAELTTGGTLVLGQAQSTGCALVEDAGVGNVSSPESTGCDEMLSGSEGPGGLEAEVQHLRLWSKFVTADEVAQQMHEPFEGNSIGQVLHWDFTSALIDDHIVEDASGIGVSVSGVANHGILSENGTRFVQASPSLNPGYPCGKVHSGIWRFAAPEDFITALQHDASYGGRFQFRLAYTSANGDTRSTRGAVTIRSRGGLEISWNLIFGLAETERGEWTYVSVVLREDHGWLSEPLGGLVTAAEMKAILADAGELLIRGDIRVFGKQGGGLEVVYLQDVQLLAKA